MEGSIQQMMNTRPIPFQVTNWNTAPEAELQGESGFATSKTVNAGGWRIRIVKYSSGYRADHWCSLGHITYCLEGEFTSELSDGRTFRLSAGMSYQVSDGLVSHRSYSETGATLLIVDGDFLKTERALRLNPWKM